MPICVFVIRLWHKWISSWRGPYKRPASVVHMLYAGSLTQSAARQTSYPGVRAPARSHNFVETDHEIISIAILSFPLIHTDSRRVVISYWQKNVHYSVKLFTIRSKISLSGKFHFSLDHVQINHIWPSPGHSLLLSNLYDARQTRISVNCGQVLARRTSHRRVTCPCLPKSSILCLCMGNVPVICSSGP